MPISADNSAAYPYVSTGHLPPHEEVTRLVAQAYELYRPNEDGANSQVYPALARAPRNLFGVCVAGTGGEIFAIGDAEHEFAIMSVSKPFVFALVCQAVGAGTARGSSAPMRPACPSILWRRSKEASDGRTNPMVNAGAIATTSLVPGETADRNGR